MSQPIATFKVVSFGCKVNQTEGLALADRLRRRGLTEVGRRARADLVIVNTCCVTAEAARQGRQQIRRARRRGTAVAVTGCAAHAASGDAALARIEGLAAVDADKDRLLARLVETDCVPDAREPRCQAPLTSLPVPGTSSGTRRAGPSQPRSRAMLKVQDGCPGGCAYCIVPKVRPEVRSVPPEDAARQAEALTAEGFREIVVCGIHLGLYGADLASSSTLAGLMERLLAVEGLGRLRLSSILPTEVDAALLALMAAEPERLCPHLHLSLQSGDDSVLAAMGRPYTAAAFLETVAEVRAALQEPAITTDVLVGFPGETDAAFERTLAVCREAGFARMHVFPFSARPGTRAADMPVRVPREVARERRRRATEVGEDLAAVYRRRLVGRREQVVLETVSDAGPAEGVAARYVRVRVDGPLPEGAARRDLVPVRLEEVEGEALTARAET
jgi:threonylcarbamoyladenosine tRNA methylthiotransferase MtaB